MQKKKTNAEKRKLIPLTNGGTCLPPTKLKNNNIENGRKKTHLYFFKFWLNTP